MKVSQVMAVDVQPCVAGSTLNEAAQRMWEYDCGMVPVVDHARTVVGTISDRDICMGAYTKGRPLHEISIAEVMSNGVITIEENATLDHARELMQMHQIRRLPVVSEHGQLVGMLSIADLSRYANGRKTKGGVTATELIETLRAITSPRKPERRA